MCMYVLDLKWISIEFIWTFLDFGHVRCWMSMDIFYRLLQMLQYAIKGVEYFK